jgi:hypothetical protein
MLFVYLFDGFYDEDDECDEVSSLLSVSVTDSFYFFFIFWSVIYFWSDFYDGFFFSFFCFFSD